MKMQVENKLSYKGVFGVVDSIFGEKMHAKRVGSLADAAFGLLRAEKLLLHKMGEGLAEAKELDKKHATKQIDRLLSNKNFDIWLQGEQWAVSVLGERKEAIFSIDWTDFDADNQSMIAVNLVTSHGRATPILWKTVNKSSLKNNRARYEDQILSQLKNILPPDITVTLLCDRGFADQRFFDFIDKTLGFFYIIRIRGGIYVRHANGEQKLAKEWLKDNGHTRCLENAALTKEEYEVPKFICTKQEKMKDAWFLASNCSDLNARTVVQLYGKRWTIEPYFRDIKDQRFGMGLQETHIKNPQRRDRLFFISSICIMLLTLLGAAGESIGFDRKLKVNTVKKRTHSLLRQGMFYEKFFKNFSPQEKSQLMLAFEQLLAQQRAWKTLLFVV
jgi:hypothetical protein